MRLKFIADKISDAEISGNPEHPEHHMQYLSALISQSRVGKFLPIEYHFCLTFSECFNHVHRKWTVFKDFNHLKFVLSNFEHSKTVWFTNNCNSGLVFLGCYNARCVPRISNRFL